MEMLSNGEKIINSEAASWGSFGHAHAGQLTLTSKRIIFEEFKGIVVRANSQTETLVNLPLTEIENIAVEGRIQKHVTIALKNGAVYNLPAQISFLVNNPQQWKEQIIEQLSTATTEPILTAKDTIAQLPQSAITRICPQCGHVLVEEDKFCPYCGKHLE
jgi:hypothetical protein